MKNILVILLIITIIILSFLGLRKNNTHKTSAEISGIKFNLEIAQTEKDKEIGLAKYKSIQKNFAMYFPFTKKGYYSFWMKDMKFPIDILYIDNGKIVAIFKNVQNPKTTNEKLIVYKPEKLADSVLEISAGLSETYGFKIGDKLRINN